MRNKKEAWIAATIKPIRSRKNQKKFKRLKSILRHIKIFVKIFAILALFGTAGALECNIITNSQACMQVLLCIISLGGIGNG